MASGVGPNLAQGTATFRRSVPTDPRAVTATQAA